MRFDEKLDRELERLGRTNAELAAASGLGKSTLSRYRRGEREPRWGSPQLWQLAKGLTALGGGDDAELEALHTALGECLSTGLRLDHATYLSRLNALCRCLDIRSSALARALAYDPSYISRILATRIPSSSCTCRGRWAYSFTCPAYCLMHLVVLRSHSLICGKKHRGCQEGSMSRSW